MMSFLTWFPFTFLILAYVSGFATAQHGCFGNNYTTNSTYGTNLNLLLSSLSDNIDNAGFYNASVGQNPDRAYAAALCRTDYQLDICRSCVHNATSELLGLCPNQKQGVFFKYICTLRYSDEPMYGIRSDGYRIKDGTVSSPRQFNENLRELLDNLRDRAASGGQLMKIAAGSGRGPDFQAIFALLQCMPDLSPEDCIACLVATEQLICCENSNRVIVYAPTCTLEYNRQPFYNMTRIEEVRAALSMPPPAPMPAAVPPLTLPPGNGDDNKTGTVTIILVPVVVCLLLAACVGYYLRKRLNKSQHAHHIESKDGDEISKVESLLYDFRRIKTATNDFSDSNKLGEGGFGCVYKAKLENGQEIAVKRLSKNSEQGDADFKNEVLLVAKLQHRNLVQLLGFSIQATERLLIYEFIQNASLDSFIFDPVRRLLLDWDRRYKIIKGIARGLLYLHEGLGCPIIHRDLKASNILLDGEMNPKIADFGTARLFQNESGGNTKRVVGTYGYMSPEYAMKGQFSFKLDVFSFGVLILEIVTGQKNNSFHNGGESVDYMLSFAWRNWRQGRAAKLIDPVLTSSSGCMREMLRCIHIGLLCVQEKPVDRPTMA